MFIWIYKSKTIKFPAQILQCAYKYIQNDPNRKTRLMTTSAVYSNRKRSSVALGKEPLESVLSLLGEIQTSHPSHNWCINR